jgi:hypothetical protein
VQELEAVAAQLLRPGLDCIGVLDFELDTRMRDGAVARPLLAPEAGPETHRPAVEPDAEDGAAALLDA